MQQTFIAWPARHSYRLKCKASGSKPLKFQWLKDGRPSIHRRLQPRLKTNKWYLKLKDLVPLDSGRYTCVVSNAYGAINHTYTLRVVGKSYSCTFTFHHEIGVRKGYSRLVGHRSAQRLLIVIGNEWILFSPNSST